MFWRKQNATQSEWTMFLIITVLAFVILLYFFRDFLFHSVFLSQDKRLFDSISFAGTVVSIILGLLAIIYTLFQGFSSQSSSERMALKLHELNNLVEASKTQNSKLEGSIDSIGLISNKISELSSDFGGFRNNHETSMQKFEEKLNLIGSVEKNKQGVVTNASGVVTIFPSDFMFLPVEALSMALFVKLNSTAERPEKKGIVSTVAEILSLTDDKERDFVFKCATLYSFYFSLAFKFSWFDKINGVNVIKKEVCEKTFENNILESSINFDEFELRDKFKKIYMLNC